MRLTAKASLCPFSQLCCCESMYNSRDNQKLFFFSTRKKQFGRFVRSSYSTMALLTRRAVAAHGCLQNFSAHTHTCAHLNNSPEVAVYPSHYHSPRPSLAVLGQGSRWIAELPRQPSPWPTSYCDRSPRTLAPSASAPSQTS